ncbi:disease resistance protein RGA2-like [Pistacia vera]|uniref:disease resistance protein RGA2-like n=1 Tax=Pistacia vera TaxID=55513 RepID=UPI0012630BB2|nr:disease resistance protein RGA2-like [Pistacia vera]
MADAIVAAVFEQLASILQQQIIQGCTSLGGVDEDVRKLERNFQAIGAVLNDVGMLESTRGHVVRDQLQKLREISYDIEDVLDKWKTGMQKLQMQEAEVFPLNRVSGFLSRHVLRYSVSLKIENINKALDDVDWERNRLNFRVMNGHKEPERYISSSFIDVLGVHGRDQERSMIVNLLLSESSQGANVSTISIVGMEGVGKKTLAQLVFNDSVVKSHFEKQIWVCVTHLFSEIKIAKAILESLIGVATLLVELKTILHHIRHFVKGKKFLLVLDDVWSEDFTSWELLKVLNYGSQGSKILVTRCKENLANIMGTSNIFPIGVLSREGCWSLFSQLAFFRRTYEDRENLEDIGRKIVGKCRGFPFAVKILGSLLCFKRKVADWKMVLDSDIWELEEEEIEAMR